jgi:hypothetical protein
MGQRRRLDPLEREHGDVTPQGRRRGRLAKAPAFWLAMQRRAQGLPADPRATHIASDDANAAASPYEVLERKYLAAASVRQRTWSFS